MPGSVPDGASGFGNRRSAPFLKEVPNRGIGMRPEVRMAVRIDPFPAPSLKGAQRGPVCCSLPNRGSVQRAPTKKRRGRIRTSLADHVRGCARITGLPRQASINVTGIRAVRQRLEPSLCCLSIDLLCEGLGVGSRPERHCRLMSWHATDGGSGSTFAVPSRSSERPESAHLARCGAFRRSSPF
jgi:hypothetical protein